MATLELTGYFKKDLKINCGASYDVAGVFGDPNDAQVFWSQVSSGNFSPGLEAIGFKHSFEKMMDSEKKLPLIGVHTRMGHPENGLHGSLLGYGKRFALDRLIHDPTEIVEPIDSLGRPAYVLTHDVHMRTTKNIVDFKNKQDGAENVSLVVENDVLPESTRCSVEIVRERSDNKCINCFDILHHAKEHKLDWHDPKSLTSITNHIIVNKPALLHIPIGYCRNYNEDDALPYDIPNEFWQNLAFARRIAGSLVIFECQMGLGNGALTGISRRSWNEKVNFVRNRLKPILEAGILV